MACCDRLLEPRVFIAPVTSFSDGKGQGQLLSLRHPKSGNKCFYVFLDGHLHEINWFKQSYGSWFLGNYVCKDDSLHICTRVDPIFIFLPIFDKARLSKGNNPKMFRQLDEILYVEGYSNYQQLKSVAEHHMEIVCEVKEVASQKFYRLDDSKVLSWLFCKVQTLKETFPKMGKNYAAREEKETLKDIVQILREYLTDEPWLKMLCNLLLLDWEEINGALKGGTASVFEDNAPASSHSTEADVKAGSNSGASRSGKQSKKPKTQVDPQSQNIMDMFRRVTRRTG